MIRDSRISYALAVKPQDLAVAAALQTRGPTSFSALAIALGLSASETHGAVRRLEEAGLVNAERAVVRQALREFLVHGLKYVFPARPGALSLGVPTAGAAPALAATFPPLEIPWVWPWPEGTVRGLTIEPLYRTLPGAALKDPALYEVLALMDALRAGRARERQLAEHRLREVLA